ncbi:MAG: hypothetical protein CVT99_16170 [Bacteroidetes bacterium HGW-Bacteroidetes-16]|nr:MAG: hypothetical protein CVT99_16170 [Bacteroidetes bacterium HGW-Bacteroidetes-16]
MEDRVIMGNFILYFILLLYMGTIIYRTFLLSHLYGRYKIKVKNKLFSLDKSYLVKLMENSKEEALKSLCNRIILATKIISFLNVMVFISIALILLARD